MDKPIKDTVYFGDYFDNEESEVVEVCDQFGDNDFEQTISDGFMMMEMEG